MVELDKIHRSKPLNIRDVPTWRKLSLLECNPTEYRKCVKGTYYNTLYNQISVELLIYFVLI